jgi:hypothetical protein
MALAFGLPSGAQDWLTNGLAAYYTFSGNANDESGNGRHGQIAGTVVQAPDRFGEAGRAYHFGEAYGCIDVTAPVFNLGQPEFTVSGWFCTDDATKLYQNIINTIPHAGFMLELNNESALNRMMFSVGDGYEWTALYLAGALTNYTNQVWHQFAFVKSGTNYTVYINGQVDGAHSVPAAAGYNLAAGYRFGAINSGFGNWQGFRGRLDDMRIYNRALSADEVTRLYIAEYAPKAGFVKACTVDFSSLIIGSNYQAQASSDCIHWTNWGAPFTATSSVHTNSSYHRVDDWDRLFFRVQRQ